MKIKDLKEYNGKMVKIRTRHSVVRTGILQIIDNDTIKVIKSGEGKTTRYDLLE